jgi:oligoendopeptidase F
MAPIPSTAQPLTRESVKDSGGHRDLGAMPEWNLADLYPAMDSPELKADFERAGTDCRAFAERYEGKLASIGGDGLAGAIAAYERIENRLGRIMS